MKASRKSRASNFDLADNGGQDKKATSGPGSGSTSTSGSDSSSKSNLRHSSSSHNIGSSSNDTLASSNLALSTRSSRCRRTKSAKVNSLADESKSSGYQSYKKPAEKKNSAPEQMRKKSKGPSLDDKEFYHIQNFNEMQGVALQHNLLGISEL